MRRVVQSHRRPLCSSHRTTHPQQDKQNNLCCSVTSRASLRHAWAIVSSDTISWIRRPASLAADSQNWTASYLSSNCSTKPTTSVCLSVSLHFLVSLDTTGACSVTINESRRLQGNKTKVRTVQVLILSSQDTRSWDKTSETTEKHTRLTKDFRLGVYRVVRERAKGSSSSP